MHLPQRAGLERHIDPGKLLGDGELGDRGFLGGAALEDLRRHRAERETERGKLRSGERRRRRSERWLLGFEVATGKG